jgi:hypothetical protein
MAGIELTNYPTSALYPGAVLIIGCERQESGDVYLRVSADPDDYIGFRAGPAADGAERAWNTSHSTHLWAVPR